MPKNLRLKEELSPTHPRAKLDRQARGKATKASSQNVEGQSYEVVRQASFNFSIL